MRSVSSTRFDAGGSRTLRILISVPCVDLFGGVANYYRTVKPYFLVSVVYCVYGPRTNVEMRRGTGILRLLENYRSFWLELRHAEYNIVTLNPSLTHKSLVRDAGFLLIAKMLRRRVIVFLRGWDHSIQAKLERRLLWMFKCIFFRADSFIVLAHEFKAFLLSVGYGKPVFIETTAVDDKVFATVDAPARSARNRFNVLSRPPRGEQGNL